MIQEFWEWKEFFLSIEGFAVFRIYIGNNAVILTIKIEEEAGERKELIFIQ